MSIRGIGAADGEAMSFDEILQDKAYQSEFDRRVTKALDTARDKWETDALAPVKNMLEQANKQLDGYKGIDVDGLRRSAEEFRARAEGAEKASKEVGDKYEALKRQVETEKTIAAKHAKAREWLVAKGLNADIAEDLLLDKLDYDALVLDKDGNIKDADKYFEPHQERIAKYATITTITGAGVATPPASPGSIKNPWLKENRNAAEQTRLYREDPEKAREMARAAGINL